MNPDNQRIAKNTLLLYGRTFITIIIGIYTSRVMLDALGIDNFGINNVVAGIVTMATVVTGTMTGAVSRYITYELGTGDIQRLKTVFVTSVNALIIIALLAMLALEVAGVWWLNMFANIPLDRMFAANWALQTSILSLFISLVAVPYRSCIVAHERMSIYAYMTIVDVVLKLLIVFSIAYYDGDRLILLSNLTVIINAILTFFYGWYSHKNFQECRYSFHIDKPLLKEMTSYSGWNLIDSSAWMLNTQGVNMLINVFFGVAFNAARGIAVTVSSCARNFVGNFSMAFSPQLTKSYASGEYDKCYILANRGARITWLLMLIFIVPICIEAEMLLSLWLVNVPPMAALFLRLTMFEALSVQFGEPLFSILKANGNVKNYCISSAFYAGVVFPTTWVAYKLGAQVWVCYVFFIVIYSTLNFVRLFYLKKYTSYTILSFFSKVMYPCIITTIFAFVLPLIISFYWHPSITRFFILSIISVLNVLAAIYLFGLDNSEKDYAKCKLYTIFGKLKQHHT